MNRIDRKFNDLKKSGKKAFIAYITAGDPDINTTREQVLGFSKAGVDIVEIGVPFSDPMADGPVIQRAMERALKSGTTFPKIISLINDIRTQSQIPIVLFSYYNPIFQYGLEKFAADASSAGIDGVLVVDMPFEESAGFRKILKKNGIRMILLTAPTSGNERIRKISSHAEGFLYAVSRPGVTGAKDKVPEDLTEFIKTIRQYTNVPVAVGFGISTAEQLKNVQSVADAAVVGSAIVQKIAENIGEKDLIDKVIHYVSELKFGK